MALPLSGSKISQLLGFTKLHIFTDKAIQSNPILIIVPSFHKSDDFPKKFKLINRIHLRVDACCNIWRLSSSGWVKHVVLIFVAYSYPFASSNDGVSLKLALAQAATYYCHKCFCLLASSFIAGSRKYWTKKCSSLTIESKPYLFKPWFKFLISWILEEKL